nr:long-chain-alcohol O-fatty-acyltransferase-like [Quercus suber]
MTRSMLLVIKALFLAMIIRAYDHRSNLHPYVILALYCCHTYLAVEIVLALAAAPVQAIFGFEIEPQFNEPYFATSLQDFWGHRWNLMVTSILRPTVYILIHCISANVIGSRWAALPAIISTFIMSGLAHEVIYFHFTRVHPTWEVTWFFVLHGVCTAIEVVVKKAVTNRWQLHRAVSGPLTIVFVAVTGGWLFFPQLIRNSVDIKAIEEYSILVDFVKVNLPLHLPLGKS